MLSFIENQKNLTKKINSFDSTITKTKRYRFKEEILDLFSLMSFKHMTDEDKQKTKNVCLDLFSMEEIKKNYLMNVCFFPKTKKVDILQDIFDSDTQNLLGV